MPNDPEYKIEDIDPVYAKELLSKNTHNRNLRPRVVASYANDMRDGMWQQNGDSIKIADDGRVIDGQHRLHAIIESDTTQRMLVARGLPMTAQDVIDTGAKRTFADVLKLRGEDRYIPLAAVTRRVNVWERGLRTVKGNYVATNTQLLATLERHPDIRISAEVGDRVRSHIPIHCSVIGLTHWLFTHIPTATPEDLSQLNEDVREFFDRLCDGADLAVNHPIATLRRTAIENMTSRARLNELVMTAYVIKAWNSYRDGKTATLFRYRVGGANPEQFPEPK